MNARLLVVGALVFLVLNACESSPPECDGPCGGGSASTGGGAGGGGPLTDAGVLDAGDPDAGGPDAGGPDAGDPDAGGSDAGGSDAGGSDAGPLPVELELSATSLTLVEGGQGTFTLRLTSAPTATLTVSLSMDPPSVALTSSTSIDFGPTDWDQPRTIAVDSAQDDDVVDGSATITLTAAGSMARLVTVTVTDDDVQSIILTPAVVTEGQSASLPVSLRHRPAGALTVTLSASDPARLVLGTNALTFLPSDYATPQTVTLTAQPDVDVASQMVLVTAAAPGVATASTMVTLTDVDVLGLALEQASVTAIEGTSGHSFGVRLTAQPSSNVSVSVAASDARVVLAQGTVTFTPANWNLVQGVSFSTAHDDDLVDDVVELTLTAPGVASVVQSITVTDDDTQAVQPGASSLTVVEGATQLLPVRLAFRPSANVTVSVLSANPAAATVSPASLTFTPADFATAQTITVSGVHDPDLAPANTTLSLASSGLPSVSVSVSVTDDDVQALIITPPSLVVLEPGTGQFLVRLLYPPLSSVTVTPGANSTKVTVPAIPMTFTPSNWAVPQSVQVLSVPDGDNTNETATVTFQAPGVTTATATVTVIDQNPP